MPRRSRSLVAGAIADALAVVVPVECAGCGAPDRAVCDSCAARLEPRVAPRSLDSGLVVHCALRYEEVPRRVILALKEEGRTEVARYLAPALSAALAATPHGVEVVAVPPSRASLRRRGFDPLESLLRRGGFRPARVLRIRSGAKQQSLDVAQRAANRAGSMRAIGSLAGRRIVLVDDVMTTGATLAEAERAIREVGGEVAGAAALAFTPRLFADRL